MVFFTRVLLVFGIGLGLLVGGSRVVGQEAPATQPTAQPDQVKQPVVMDGGRPSAEEVQAQLQGELKVYPESRTSMQSSSGPAFSDAPPVTAPMEINRAVIGPAPGEAKPTLMREGQFVVNRRGHIQRTGAGADQVLFVFAADSEGAPETPMVLVPCQMLENMESIVYERGERTTFLLSGQVLAYRGVNYVLPTMMKIALDRGNLKP